jgi:hypothetical protein
VHDDYQYGSASMQAGWFLNSKNRQVILARPVSSLLSIGYAGKKLNFNIWMQLDLRMIIS